MILIYDLILIEIIRLRNLGYHICRASDGWPGPFTLRLEYAGQAAEISVERFIYPDEYYHALMDALLEAEETIENELMRMEVTP